ncbi:MAG: CobB/CobQ domain protein glutamine amidotransferase [Pseudonocardia sp.]|nr:CobB/CobQ domain protein glutamine amidotransferase [Pseudonocardia sp.]
MTAAAEVSIGLLLPDVLGTYSDAGNATVLAQRLRWRGIGAMVHTITARDEPPLSCEVYLLGGGEDRAQQFATSWLRGKPKLLDTLAERAVTLAVCAGLQVLGETMTDPEGRHLPGVGVLDLRTTPRRTRAIGEAVIECNLAGVGLLTGFENHGGGTALGPGLAPLGRVVAGVGNGADTPVDGVLTEHIIGTYLHGPVLARNPALADHILQRVTGQPLPPIDLPDVPALRRTYLNGHGSGEAGRSRRLRLRHRSA